MVANTLYPPSLLDAAAVPLRGDDAGGLRVGATRVSLDSVLYAFNNGCLPEEIVLKFPTLDLADVYAVVSHYLRHRAAFDAYLEKSRELADAMMKQCETEFPLTGIRERLLARAANR